VVNLGVVGVSFDGVVDDFGEHYKPLGG
jgi:hypothetical protein